MEDARALLDSLMGQTRNDAGKAAKENRKKSKTGDGFKHDSVCKLWLVGFCPENEELFHNTKRDLGVCGKTHYEMHREEFNAHPDKDKYHVLYESQLLIHLNAILRRNDEFTAKEKAKNEEVVQKHKSFAARAPNKEVQQMKDMASKLLNEAEDLAGHGDFEGSKKKVNSAKDYEKKAADLEEKPLALPEVCEICGSIKESEFRSAFKHEAGKVHQGVLMLKKMHADLKMKEAKGELTPDKDLVEEEERYRHERKREERREREAQREREAKEREEKARKEREREREAREREVREREERGRRRERSRSAGDRRRAKAEDRTNDGKRGGGRSIDDRVDRDAGRARRRREDEVADQPSDSHGDDARKKRRREDEDVDGEKNAAGDRPASGSAGGDQVDKKDKEKDKDKDSEAHRYKVRFVQRKFMDLLVNSGAVTGSTTYEELESVLGQKDDWQACDKADRMELANEFIDAIKKMNS